MKVIKNKYIKGRFGDKVKHQFYMGFICAY